MKKPRNTYNLDVTPCICYTKKGEEIYFDKEDYDLIKDYTWGITPYNYARAYDSKTKKMIQMHRLIMNPPDNKIVDHINHNKRDNTKKNLRICTYKENNWNRNLRSNNTSGTTGIFWSKQAKKWRVALVCNKEYHHIGYFKTKTEAKKARKEAEEKYFGDYRCCTKRKYVKKDKEKTLSE